MAKKQKADEMLEDNQVEMNEVNETEDASETTTSGRSSTKNKNRDEAKEIFDNGQNDGKSRDEIVVAMVMAGNSLNTAQILYKEFAQDAGLTSSRVGYKAEALEFISEEVQSNGADLTDSESRSTLRQAIQDKFGVAQSTANDYVKAYAEENGIELPSSNFGANPEDRNKIFEWIVQNPNTDKEQFREFMETEMNRGKGSIDETWRGIVLARQLQEAGVVFEG